RHTRSDRDWSSDVCSSDLGADADPAEPDRSRDRAQGTCRGPLRAGAARGGAGVVEFRIGCAANILLGGLSRYLLGACLLKTPVRSEERRVGKECRYWRVER